MAYEEQRNSIYSLTKENAELKDNLKGTKYDLKKTSNQLQQKDGEVVNKTVTLSQAEEVHKLKDQADTDDVKFKSLEEALKKADDDLVVSNKALNEANQKLMKAEEALMKAEETAVERYKSSTDYNVDSLSFFLDGYEELKKQ